MNISEPFIRRPVATTLFTAGHRAGGHRRPISKLPVSPLPQVDLPTIIGRQRDMAGASPETMATTVATPLERHLGTIADVTEMTSSSSVGQHEHHAPVRPQPRHRRRRPRRAGRDQRGARGPADGAPEQPDLPEVEPRRRADPDPRAHLEDADPGPALRRRLDHPRSRSSPRCRASATSSVWGSSLPAVRVELNPSALFKYGVGLEDVRAALAAANANSPKGAIENATLHWQIYDNDQSRNGQGLPSTCRRLPQRRARPPDRRRRRHGLGRGHPQPRPVRRAARP